MWGNASGPLAWRIVGARGNLTNIHATADGANERVNVCNRPQLSEDSSLVTKEPTGQTYQWPLRHSVRGNTSSQWLEHAHWRLNRCVQRVVTAGGRL